MDIKSKHTPGRRQEIGRLAINLAKPNRHEKYKVQTPWLWEEENGKLEEQFNEFKRLLALETKGQGKCITIGEISLMEEEYMQAIKKAKGDL